MKLIKNIDDAFVSNIANAVVPYGNFLDSLEVTLGNDDYILSDGKRAVISISKNNYFVIENDKKGIEILLLKRILSLKFSGPLSEILADREIIKFGLSEKLFYYYYVLLSLTRKINGIEDFVQINIPWLSFYPYDKENSKILHELEGKHTLNYRKEFQAATAKLFALLQRNLYTARALSESEEEWLSLLAKSEVENHGE